MNKKIKILFAINCMNIGGAPAVVFDQLKHINKDKFDSYLLTLYPSKEANFLSKIDFLEKEKIKQFKLRNRSIFDFKTLFAIYRYIKKEKFDVVYTHLFLTNFLVRFLSVLARVPVIISFEHSMYFNKSKWQIAVDKFLSKFTNKIIVSTESVADFTSKQEKIIKDKFTIIPNSISLPDKRKTDKENLKKEFHIRENDFIVMSLGRFSKEKEQIYLIEVADKILNKYNDITFVLIGHGPQEKVLREQIEKKNLRDKFKLIKEPARAKEFYYIGDLFVLPSSREGQSIVTYEAMEAGVPVVASDLESLRDIIIDGENGFLFPVKDISKMEDLIIRLYENSELREKISRRAKEDVKDFKIEKIILKLEDLIIKLLNGER